MEGQNPSGCDPSAKVSVRTPLEEKLKNNRKRVCFTHSGETAEQKDNTCCSGYENLSDQPEMVVTPVAQRPPNDHFVVGLKGYGQPYQHPAWTTTQSIHGRFAPPPGLNPVRFKRNTSFTNMQGLGGMASDGHFTTSIETEYVYKPMKG
ncbi:hypothetical protein RRG08_002957 [Elysia crispata]|uniref:Uncharacterized protein n=1 Tax=Elysia crispata TaxID=231223 RepID=A0AAE1APH0_9GAST|nr:hypothetical protein RRG08_002957 [Elysia crispata]